MISADDIKKFQELYRERYGKEIGEEEARAQATALVQMIKNIYKPMTEAEYLEVQK